MRTHSGMPTLQPQTFQAFSHSSLKSMALQAGQGIQRSSFDASSDFFSFLRQLNQPIMGFLWLGRASRSAA